jgi:hypothetical protein
MALVRLSAIVSVLGLVVYVAALSPRLGEQTTTSTAGGPLAQSATSVTEPATTASTTIPAATPAPTTAIAPTTIPVAHYHIMISATYTHVGIGVVVGADGRMWTTHLFAGL